jgi:hypothetical protein
MTEREALKLALGFVEEHARHWTGVGRSGRDVVTAVKEALAQPEQEPVAIADGTFNHNCPVGTPLYTTPPQRTWVGLTDEEIDQGLLLTNHALQTAVAWREGVEWATEQLKEKNT